MVLVEISTYSTFIWIIPSNLLAFFNTERINLSIVSITLACVTSLNISWVRFIRTFITKISYLSAITYTLKTNFCESRSAGTFIIAPNCVCNGKTFIRILRLTRSTSIKWTLWARTSNFRNPFFVSSTFNTSVTIINSSWWTNTSQIVCIPDKSIGARMERITFSTLCISSSWANTIWRGALWTIKWKSWRTLLWKWNTLIVIWIMSIATISSRLACLVAPNSSLRACCWRKSALFAIPNITEITFVELNYTSIFWEVRRWWTVNNLTIISIPKLTNSAFGISTNRINFSKPKRTLTLII